jgi:hypothetical protein
MPLALAFLWERLATLKLLGIEVTLAQESIRADQVSTLTEALSPQHIYYSDEREVLKQFGTMIGATDLQVLEVNLHSTAYWWSTRLYLLAALAVDFSPVEQIVFVDRDAERRYVGMTTARALKKALVGMLPDLDRVYYKTRSEGVPGDAQEVERIVIAWTTSTFKVNGIDLIEQNARAELSTDQVLALVALGRRSIEWDQPLDSALLQYLVLEGGTRFVALTSNERLQMVVNAAAFGRQVALRTLRSRLP